MQLRRPLEDGGGKAAARGADSREAARRRAAVAVAGIALLVLSCGDGAVEPAPPPAAPVPTTVTVSPASASMTALGDTVRLTVEVRDQNGQVMAGATVAWSSSDASVATVDASGLVTAAANGSVTITATAGSVSGTAAVTVAQVVSAVAVSPAADTLVAFGDTVRLVAEATDANGQGVAGSEFLWSSSDTLVAKVDDSGLVESLAEGGAVITATASGVAGEAELSVVPPLPTSVAVSPDTVQLTALGQTAQLTAEVREQAGRVMAEAFVTWSSGDTLVAAVDSTGLVTAAGGGTTTVTAAAGDVSDTVAVTVMQSADSVVVSPSESTIGVGDTLRLVAEAFDENGHRLDGAVFSWSSADGGIARVDEAGLVEAVAEGTTTITATAGDASAVAEITVENPDRAALVALYEATDGPAWVDNTNWLTDAPLGEWHGVDTDATGRVERMYLGGNGLSGAIPSALGNLANLRQLGLGHNYLSGAIPSALGNLANLRQLGLGTNLLTGAIPPELGNLGALTVLILERNDLSGPVPPSFLQLNAIESFWIGGNEGLCIPGRSVFLSWLRGIERRDEEELLCNAADVAALRSLHQLAGGPAWTESGGWLGDRGVEEWHGVSADSLGRITALDLTANGLAGRLPASVGQLARMTELRIGGNAALSGRLPLSLAGLSLQTLHYADTAVCAPADRSFREWLAAIPSHEGTSGECPPLSDREILQVFYESTGGSNWKNNDNWLTDAPLREWYGVDRVGSNRYRLTLSRNNLTGPIPPELGGLTNLRQLWLSGNELTGPIPPELAGLANLDWLDLSGNELTGPIRPQLAGLANLRQLWLSGNELTGPIPPELGSFASLEFLSLENNQLTGPVPPEFGDMAKLQELGLTNNNGMRGPLPVALTSLKALHKLTTEGTGLCAPPDLNFQAWLQGVPRRRITQCAYAGEPPMAYLTQAVQSREFPVPLVAGKRALLRVFPTARQATSAGIPLIRARFYLGGHETHVQDIAGKSNPIPTEVYEGSLARSANAEIAGEVIQPGLEMVIEVDPDGTLDPALGVAQRIPETGRLSIDVQRMPTFYLTVVPYLWTAKPDSLVDLAKGMAEDPENHPLLQETRRLLPVGDMVVTAHEPVMTNSGVSIAALQAIQLLEGGKGHYLGFIRQGGWAVLGGRFSVAEPHPIVVAHELGHNMSLSHSPCRGTPGADPSYPYPDGSSGAWGYDFSDGGGLVSPSVPDLMAYCRPLWISDYHFTNALRYRLIDEGSPAGAAVAAKSLLLWGGVGADSVPYLEPAFVVDAPAALPDSSGEHRITGNTAGGSELFSFSFAMPEVADGDGSSSFAFVLPVRPGWAETLAVITLSGPGGSFTLDGESDLGMAILRNPRTGQVRGILRDHPPPNGAAADAVGQSVETGLDVLFSRGIPGAEAWRR